MKKLLLALLGFIFISLLSMLGLWLLDTKSSVLPKTFRNTLRQTLGYCIDSRQTYLKNSSFIVSSNGGCNVCICVPELGGISCQYNKDITSCEQ
jgi:hypothetical protein